MFVKLKRKLSSYYIYIVFILFIIFLLMPFLSFINSFDCKNKQSFTHWYITSYFCTECSILIIAISASSLFKEIHKYIGKKNKKWKRRGIASIATLVLLSNIWQMDSILFVFFSRLPDSILIFKEEPHLQQYLGYYKYFYKFLFFLNSPTSTLYFSPDSHYYLYIWNYYCHDPYTYFYLIIFYLFYSVHMPSIYLSRE